jgi:hypothetical protein
MQTVDDVERALISLLYASAELSERKEQTSNPAERASLEKLLCSVQLADRVLRLALGVWDRRAHRPEAALQAGDHRGAH